MHQSILITWRGSYFGPHIRVMIRLQLQVSKLFQSTALTIWPAWSHLIDPIRNFRPVRNLWWSKVAITRSSVHTVRKTAIMRRPFRPRNSGDKFQKRQRRFWDRLYNDPINHAGWVGSRFRTWRHTRATSQSFKFSRQQDCRALFFARFHVTILPRVVGALTGWLFWFRCPSGRDPCGWPARAGRVRTLLAKWTHPFHWPAGPRSFRGQTLSAGGQHIQVGSHAAEQRRGSKRFPSIRPPWRINARYPLQWRVTASN